MPPTLERTTSAHVLTARLSNLPIWVRLVAALVLLVAVTVGGMAPLERA